MELQCLYGSTQRERGSEGEREMEKQKEREEERRTEMESAEGFESAAQIAHKVLNHACTEHTHMHINTFFRSTISYWELKNQSHRYWYRSIICTVKSALQIFLWLDVQPLILRHARVLFLLISIWCVVTPRQHLRKAGLSEDNQKQGTKQMYGLGRQRDGEKGHVESQ